MLLLAGAGSAQQLLITHISVQSSNVCLGWTSQADRYIVAQTPSLTGQFQYVGNVLSTNSASLTNAAPSSFYRVREVTVVHFPDPTLCAVVSNAIVTWYEPRSEIYDIDGLESIVFLNASSLGITNGGGLNALTGLADLYIDHNQLTALDLTGCTNLQLVACQNNQLANLDVSGCARLSQLWCYNNALTNLNVSGCTNLHQCLCYNNGLTNLNLSACAGLLELICANNALTNLNVTGCTNLQRIAF
jgi:Leucine-rich repeat (LRR) protein